MRLKAAGNSQPERVPIERSQLQAAISNTVRDIGPRCKDFIGVIVERVPATSGGPNWTVRGIKFGHADRSSCSEAVAAIVEKLQAEFELKY